MSRLHVIVLLLVACGGGRRSCFSGEQAEQEADATVSLGDVVDDALATDDGTPDDSPDDTAPTPSEGFVRHADGTAAHNVRLLPLNGGATLSPAPGDGRIAAGVYQMEGSDMYLAVNARKVTWMRRGATRGPLIGGRRFALDVDAKVVVPGDDGALDLAAYALENRDGLPLFGNRYLEPGKLLRTDGLLNHRDQIRYAILHAEGASSVQGVFRALVGRGLSMHFVLERDGTLYQLLELGLSAYQAGEGNNNGIGIELVDTVEGVFTDAQYRTLGSLLRLLANVFPALDNGPPRENGDIVKGVYRAPTTYRGVMGLSHWEALRKDPGPTFDWTRLGLGQPPQ